MLTRRFVLSFVWACVAVLALAPAHAAQLRCTTLRVEGFESPLGLGEREPRLSWVAESDERGQRVSAYRVCASASLEALERGEGDLWDSGRVEAASTVHVAYAGAALVSRQRVWWRVMVWDALGRPGAWSEPAVFEMGLLDAADHRARWLDATPRRPEVEVISATYYTPGVRHVVTGHVAALVGDGRPVIASNDALGGDPAFGTAKRLEVRYRSEGRELVADVAENQAVSFGGAGLPLLRRGFALGTSPVVRARLYATALGVYELHLNGRRVGESHLAPGWTDYRERVHVHTYDVTGLVRAGANVLGCVVGPGWFSGRVGLFHISRFYGESPALWAQLEILHADGTTTTVATDEHWVRHDGPTLVSDMMDGEAYDARLEIDGWAESGLNDQGWERASVREERRALEPAPDHPVRVLATRAGERVTQPAPGRFVFDLGQNIVGVALLTVSAPGGTVLTVRHAEMLNPDGTIYTANLRGAAAIDTYTCRGARPGQVGRGEVWQPAFTFHGFRYVEVSGLPEGLDPIADPGVLRVEGVVLGSDLATRGHFECSDGALNQLFSNIEWGLRGNYLSVPTDCPQRDERMGWTADAQVFAPTALWNVDAAPFLGKWLTDLRDAQRADGAFPDVAPNTRGLTYGVPGWADAGAVVPWTIHEMTGDVRVLERNIDAMVRWVAWCKEHSTGLIRDRDRGNDYGDWLSINADTPKDLIGTAYFARSTELTARALRVLGREGEAIEHERLWEEIREAFNARFVDGDARVTGRTQTGYLMALGFGLARVEQRGAMIEHLVGDIRARGNRLSTGFLGVGLLLPVLTAHGRGDVAAELIMQDAFPSWLFSVRHGATTIWERWDGWTPATGPHPDHSMNSFNHYSLGSCGEWLFSGIGGIGRGSPGFERVVIRPVMPRGLAWASASYESVRGRLATRWEVDGGVLTLRVTIPVGVTATVAIPTRDAGEVRESGVALGEAKGVTILDAGSEVCLVEIGSGEYAFTSPMAARRSGNPIMPGWYADPEVARFDGRVWVYPTTSAAYDDQVSFDAFSSDDLVNWTRHPRVLTRGEVSWARRAMWAPSVVEHRGRYYFFFSANDIQGDGEVGGIGVAVGDAPEGPFADLLGKPLVGAFHHGAQPIDQFVFKDVDGSHYLMYGGWGHCNIARLADDFRSLVPFDDGEVFKEVTPEGYVEGAFMFVRGGRYYFMWSEGGWTGPDYAVAYAVADSPLGPWRREGVILRQDAGVGTGAGHHSVLSLAGDEHYIVYHRRPLGETHANHRVVCIDRLEFDERGRIRPVSMTFEGVVGRSVGAQGP